MDFESGAHETRRTISMDCSPKSVNCRMGPPPVGIAQILVVPRSLSGAASHRSSGDSIGFHKSTRYGMREAVILAKATAGPFSGRARLIFMVQSLPDQNMKYSVEPSDEIADRPAWSHRTVARLLP